MLNGFQKIIEERIRKAQEEGEFDNLQGLGKPLCLDDGNIPEELRLSYKILKNAGCLPPEVELKKEIGRIEDSLAAMSDVAEKYQALKRLNFLILKLNMSRHGSVGLDMPQRYEGRIVEHLISKKPQS